jgi:hypothetical protein
MRNRGLSGLIFLILVLALAGSLNAMMIELSPAELRAQADVIITGNVAGVTSQWDDTHSTIFTDVVVSVERFDKGNAPRRLTVRVPGGEVGDVGMAVEDIPTFAPGQKVSLHLRRTADRAVFKLARGGQGGALRGKPGRSPKLYSYSGYHRNPASCYYRVHTDLPSDWSNAIQAGAETWSDAGSAFRFYYAGTTTATGPNYDGYNVVCDSNMGDNGILAVNYYWYTRRGKIVVENDIVFNTYYPWSTSGAATYYDVQNIGTHELGHCLILDDLYSSYQSEQTMYGHGALGETKKRSLESGDIDGMNYIY